MLLEITALPTILNQSTDVCDRWKSVLPCKYLNTHRSASAKHQKPWEPWLQPTKLWRNKALYCTRKQAILKLLTVNTNHQNDYYTTVQWRKRLNSRRNVLCCRIWDLHCVYVSSLLEINLPSLPFFCFSFLWSKSDLLVDMIHLVAGWLCTSL